MIDIERLSSSLKTSQYLSGPAALPNLAAFIKCFTSPCVNSGTFSDTAIFGFWSLNNWVVSLNDCNLATETIITLPCSSDSCEVKWIIIKYLPMSISKRTANV